MNPSKWTAEHGNLLKTLRQKAGLDIATLARKHILSTTQIGQLEGGGDSAFYNAEIKFSIGKKLLHALGHDLPEIELPNIAPATTVSPVIPIVQNSQRTSFSITPQNFAWPLLFLLIAFGVLGFYIENKDEKNQAIHVVASTSNLTKPTEIAPEKTSSENTSPSEPAITAAPTVVEPEKVSLQTKVAVPPSTCNWRSAEIEIQPTSPRKSADYVHMIAQQNGLVCIKDAEQRVATLELQAGDERSIYGPAPFNVYSATLSQIKVYFQGQLMKLPTEDVQHLKLTATAR
jgi:transcriptional regulator with XRE-family HTH domain